MIDGFNAFNEVGAFGQLMFDCLGGKSASQAIKDDLNHLEKLFGTFAQIHKHVIRICLQTRKAPNLAQARTALEQILNSSLYVKFKARNWCEKIGDLAKSLESLAEEADQTIAIKWRQIVYQREGEVLSCYNDALFDLRGCFNNNGSLEEIQSEANKALEKLTLQKAQFDDIAQKARIMLSQLN